jgi:hypothetical protein
MLLLTRGHLEVAGGVLALILSILGVRTWLQEHDARIHAEETVQANQKIVAASDAKEKSLEAEITARDQAAASRESAMMDAVKNLKTTQQIVPYIQREVAPNAPLPITINVPPATKDNPTPNATISIPQLDLPAFRDRLSKCDIDAIQVETCNADSVTKATQLKVAGEKLSAVSNERDAYKTELAGGTFWRRTKTAVKWIGVGGGLAIAATCGSGHCR